MKLTEERKPKKQFFSRQPFWEVTNQRENTLLRLEDMNLRVMRYNMNQGVKALDCIPGVGQLGLIFSVQEKVASAYAYGVLPEKRKIPMHGIEKALMVQFVPGSFTLATGVPADEIPADGMELEALFPWASAMVEHINSVDSDVEHYQLLFRFLEQCRVKNPVNKEREGQMAVSIADYMIQSRRSVRMKELEECYGYTARTLQKLVLKNVGITPKQLNLQICLQNAIHQMGQKDSCSLTQLSHQMEFYDQSHFYRVFRKMTGFCPGDYLRWQEQSQKEDIATG